MGRAIVETVCFSLVSARPWLAGAGRWPAGGFSCDVCCVRPAGAACFVDPAGACCVDSPRSQSPSAARSSFLSSCFSLRRVAASAHGLDSQYWTRCSPGPCGHVENEGKPSGRTISQQFSRLEQWTSRPPCWQMQQVPEPALAPDWGRPRLAAVSIARLSHI